MQKAIAIDFDGTLCTKGHGSSGLLKVCLELD